jgi:hypothetical protein
MFNRLHIVLDDSASAQEEKISRRIEKPGHADAGARKNPR